MNVLYQSCDINVKASCNCAVAVKNGDDVFVFDRCRKIKRKFNGLGGNKDVNIYKTTLYRNGELTPGTSLRDGGEGKKYIVSNAKAVSLILLISVYGQFSPCVESCLMRSC